MEIGPFITSLPSWALFSLTVIVGVLAAEAGAWLAQRRARSGIKEPEESVSTAVAAMLGLLAFMLGFTFSLSEARFDNRKTLVIEEANAISTCYLRSSFLPLQQKQEVRELMQEYVALMVEVGNPARLQRSIRRLEEIHLLLWQQTASLAGEDMDSELRSLFTGSVNEMAALLRERKTVALIYRVPDVIWTSILLLYVLSMSATGYQSGTYSMYSLIDKPLLAAAFALVLVMIADMDSSTGFGRFMVSQQPLLEVQQLMKQAVP